MKLRKNVGKLIKKYAGVRGIAAGAVSLLLVTGGFHILWEDYQNGNLFKPELFVKNRELQGNQIMFPEKENIQDDNTSSEENDNKKLERDPESDDPYGQNSQDQSAYEMSVDQLPADEENARNIFTDPSLELSEGTGNSVWNQDGKQVVLAPDAEDKISLPAGYTGLTGESSRENTQPSGSGNASSNGDGNTIISGGDSAGGGSGSSGTQDTINPGVNDTPAPTPDPTPTPTPDQPVTPDNPSDSGDNTTVVDPDYPDSSKQPDLPKDPTMGGNESIYDGDFPDDGYEEGTVEADSAVLRVTGTMGLSDSSEVEFYQGAVVTDWKILCSVYAVVDTGTGTYRIRNYSENFKIGDHPQIAEGDFTVTFYFRPNPQSPWQEVDYTIPVKYCRVVVMGAADEKGNRRTLDSACLEEGEEINLLSELQQLYDIQQKDWGVGLYDQLYEIVPGWNVNGEQEVYTTKFMPEKPGRYEMYPMERVEVPEDMRVSLEYDYTDAYVYKQILNGYYGADKEILEVPQGIQQVRLWGIKLKKIRIPASVDTLTRDFVVVSDSYEVAEDNPYFCSEDGLLFNNDKTVLLGIPTGVETLDIPETVETVYLPMENSLKQLNFKSAFPPDIDLSRVSGVQLTVPASAYADYRIGWRNILGTNVLSTSDASDYVYINGAVLSENKTVLERISDENSGLWIVPDQVRRIKAHAADRCPDVERIVVPENVEILESESLSGEGIKEIYFQGENPPEIAEDTFGDLSTKDLVVYIPDGTYEGYMEKWENVLGEETAKELIQTRECDLVETEEGATYLNVSGSAILLQAPEKFTSFDDLDLPDDITEITEIGNNAFEGCEVPKTLDIPASVTRIGRNAFAQCDDLEGILSETEEPIYIGENAFDDLRFMAYNTSYLELEDETMVRNIKTYVRTGCMIPDSGVYYILGCGDKLLMGDTEETADLLFGLDGDDTYLLNSSSDFSGELRGPEGHPITHIIRGAMMDCGEITISDDVAENLVEVQYNAFEGSGLKGEIHFSDKLRFIGNSAFLNCEDLTKVEFSDTATSDSEVRLSIGLCAFQGTGLTEVTFPANLQVLDSGVFLDTDILRITFTGSNVPTLTYQDPGVAYYFGSGDEDEAGMLRLAGEATGREEEYIAKWKYTLQGYEDESSIDENNVYWTVLSIAMSDWMDMTGEFPMDDNWEYIPEYLEYVNDMIPYFIEDIKITGEERAYNYFGMYAPEHPDRLEKPNIQDYIDAWKQRLEDEKEEALQKKEELLDPVKIPAEEEKKPKQDGEILDDPSKAEETTDQEDPEDPSEDPDETPEDPDETPEEPGEEPETPEDPSEDPDETPEEPDETPENPDDETPQEPEDPEAPETPEEPGEDPDENGSDGSEDVDDSNDTNDTEDTDDSADTGDQEDTGSDDETSADN